jgi:SAM-dependent methyltransferase
MIAERIGTGRQVFDAGCGTCHLARFLRDCTYSGIDMNRNFIEEARKRGLDVAVGDLFDFALYPEKADVLVVSDMLHHIVPRTDEYLRELSQRAPREIVICESYAYGFNFFQKILGVIQDRDGCCSVWHRLIHHFKYEYTEDILRSIFEGIFADYRISYELLTDRQNPERRHRRWGFETLIAFITR